MKKNEFEKNRAELLKSMKSKKNRKSKVIKNNNNNNTDEREKIWKYEILKYRQQKKRERFFYVGSLAGIISLILVILFHINEIKDIFQKILN